MSRAIALQTVVNSRRSLILEEVANALYHADSGVTDIESIVAATAASRHEIAVEFGGMDRIVIALVELFTAAMLQPLRDCVTNASYPLQLLDFADRVSSAYSSPGFKTLYRIALTDAIRNTGYAREFYERGPRLLKAGLACFIDAAKEAGIPINGDSQHLSSHFMALLRARLDWSDLSDDSSGSPLSPDDISKVFDMFYYGVKIGSPDARNAL